MLKGINPILTGDLLKVLSDMGHGDMIVIADGNYSATADAIRRPPIWLPGFPTLEIVEAILTVFPLEEDTPGYAIGIREGMHPVHDDFESVLQGDPEGEELGVELLTPKEFHDFARNAYAVVATTDPTHFACFALTKGVLPEPS